MKTCAAPVMVLALLVSLAAVGCGSESADSSGAGSGSSGTPSAAAASGPLAGRWVVDIDATKSYHGGFELTEEERADFEQASFEFTGGKLEYRMYGKSGEIDYEVESATDQSVVLDTSDGNKLTFQLRPDGKIVLPEDARWAIAVLEQG